MPVATSAMYVYAIGRASELPSIESEGIAGAPVETIESDELAALVSPLPPGVRVKRRDLQRHLAVLEEAFGEATILPCPFGTVVDDEELGEALLTSRRDELLEAIERLRGKVQLNVKAAYDEEELLRRIVAAHPDVARLRGSAGYHEQVRLGELVAAAVAEQRERDGNRLLAQLAEVADDVAVDPPDEQTALKASFLVSRKGVKKFDRALEAIARTEQPLLQFELIGPLPPTAFASLVPAGET